MIADNTSLLDKIKSKQPLYGIWSLLHDATCTEIMAQNFLDFIIFDGEHGTANLSQIEDNVRVLAGSKTASLVRISKIDSIEIQRVLDIGVEGIVVPQVKTVQDVEQVISYSRLAPDGIRGFNPFTRAGNYRGEITTSYFDKEKLTIGIIIENNQALNNIDEILNVDGVDLVYIGVYDLSCSLGFPGQVNHPTVLDAVDTITEHSLKRNITVGLMVENKSASIRHLKNGVTFFVFKPDTSIFANAILSLLE